MSDLTVLMEQKENILGKIRELEESCEGIENENNARKVQELNLERISLMVQKQKLTGELSALETQLISVGAEITRLSGTGIDRILGAIKEQRWYFFKNKPKVFLDSATGKLWPNQIYYSERPHTNEYREIVNKISLDNYSSWNIPTINEINELSTGIKYLRLIDTDYWSLNYAYGRIGSNRWSTSSSGNYLLFPYSLELIVGTEYEKNVSPNNPNYTEKERLQFTLNLFIEHDLWPIFDDEEITELYRKIYFEKPKLLEQLQELQSQIEDMQKITLISSTFDYTVLLAKYDVKAIDSSVIKYYQAIQEWCGELMEKITYYEEQKESVIRDFNLIGLKLSKKYEENAHLTPEENALLCDRRRFFRQKFSLGMNGIKNKILAVKKQADDLEYRIDEIDNGDNSIYELAEVEQESRASFTFVAENTAKIIKNALLKIEFFETHHQFVMNAVDLWEKWTEDYRIFCTTYKEDMKKDCEDDSIEEEVWSVWYQDWKQLRYAIELKMQPVIEWGLKGDIPVEQEKELSVPEQLIYILDDYKNNIDMFYKEERKGIYQKFVFQSGGKLQDKFETESALYKFASLLQSTLQDVIFNCKNAEDRVWILNWANSLLDIQIDDILEFVADHDLQKISCAILDEFAALKQKNYDIYLADAKAYGEEKARREKEYNSLVFKMRKNLMKQ